MKKIISLSAILVLSPVVAFADSTTSVFSILGTFNRILSFIIPILISLAVVYFIYGVIQYTISTEEEDKKGARSKIINGLIGLFIIVSFWAIISIVSDTFEVGSSRLRGDAIPCIPGPGVVCPL